MGKMQREKGKSGERELAHELRKYGFDARRGVQYKGSAGSPDVTGIDGVHIECKRVERLNIDNAMTQAIRDSGPDEMPVVCHRKNRGEWMVTMRLDDWMTLYNRAIAMMNID